MTSKLNLTLIQETLKTNQFYAVYGKKAKIKSLDELNELEKKSLKTFDCGKPYSYINKRITKMIDDVKRRKSQGAYLCLNDTVIGVAYYRAYPMRRELRCALGLASHQKLLELQIFGIAEKCDNSLLQGKGFGSFFLQCLLDSLDANVTMSDHFSGVILVPIDSKAIEFYEKNGFVLNPYRPEMLYLLDH